MWRRWRQSGGQNPDIESSKREEGKSNKDSEQNQASSWLRTADDDGILGKMEEKEEEEED